jgi:hypothetical protein
MTVYIVLDGEDHEFENIVQVFADEQQACDWARAHAAKVSIANFSARKGPISETSGGGSILFLRYADNSTYTDVIKREVVGVGQKPAKVPLALSNPGGPKDEPAFSIGVEDDS